MHNKKIKHENISSEEMNEYIWILGDIAVNFVFRRVTCLQSFKPQRDHLASDTI